VSAFIGTLQIYLLLVVPQLPMLQDADLVTVLRAFLTKDSCVETMTYLAMKNNEPLTATRLVCRPLDMMIFDKEEEEKDEQESSKHSDSI